MFVDSHVNLHGEPFSGDLPAVISRAREAQISTLLTICCKVSEFDAVVAVAEQYENIWASVGTHPHEARENPDLAHIIAARQTQLPLIIHSRNADDKMADILEVEMKNGAFPALLHCYTSGEALARRADKLGLYFSVSGIITFKNASELRDITKTLPDDRLLIETDCPYLAPVPYRGRRNEPAYVPHVAQKLADIKGWSLEEAATKTTEAFFALFTKAVRHDI